MKRTLLGVSVTLGFATSFGAMAGQAVTNTQSTATSPTLALAKQRAYDGAKNVCVLTYGGVAGVVTYTTLVSSANSYTVRASVVCSYFVPDPPYIYGVAKHLPQVEVHSLDYASGYTTFNNERQTSQADVGSDGRFQFDFADANGDGAEDLYLIMRSGTGTNRTEVHVLAGPTFTTWLQHASTTLEETGTGNDWKYLVGDFNKDGKNDIYAIKKNGGNGKTEVHVLNGADGYQTFLEHAATTLPSTGSDLNFDFALGDYNGDGKLDVYAISKNDGGTGKTALHVLNGATNFSSYLLQGGTILGQTGTTASWEFGLSDYNNDGKPDLFAFNKTGATMRLNVLNGANAYTSYLVQDKSTAINMADNGGVWQIVVGDPND